MTITLDNVRAGDWVWVEQKMSLGEKRKPAMVTKVTATQLVLTVWGRFYRKSGAAVSVAHTARIVGVATQRQVIAYEQRVAARGALDCLRDMERVELRKLLGYMATIAPDGELYDLCAPRLTANQVRLIAEVLRVSPQMSQRER